MRRPVAFDLSRMLVGAAGRTPRGIDRIDMGYARQFLAEPGTANVGLLPSLRRMGVLRGAEARAFAAVVERHWQEGRPAGEDASHRRLMARLSGEAGEPGPIRGPRRPAARLSMGARYLRLAMQGRRSPLRGAGRAVPADSLYVNIGQVLLGWPWFFDWLDRRPDVKVVAMMHDLIPVLHPEYSGPILSRHHARAVATVARRATAMIATSHASADELRAAVARLGRTDLPFHVAPLPVDDSFLVPGTADRAGRPYFVAVGIIDPRKNHRLLLHVWRDMIHRRLPAIPTLVIVGSRGLRTAEVIDMLERAPGLADHVVEVNGLSSPGLREVIRGARAVLMPSFTEGFGLPIVEALALGTPVLASDIPAHREVGGALATYLDPLDALAWRDTILARAVAPAAEEEGRRAALAGYRPQTWSSYFADVMPFLASL